MLPIVKHLLQTPQHHRHRSFHHPERPHHILRRLPVPVPRLTRRHRHRSRPRERQSTPLQHHRPLHRITHRQPAARRGPQLHHIRRHLLPNLPKLDALRPLCNHERSLRTSLPAHVIHLCRYRITPHAYRCLSLSIIRHHNRQPRWFRLHPDNLRRPVIYLFKPAQPHHGGRTDHFKTLHDRLGRQPVFIPALHGRHSHHPCLYEPQHPLVQRSGAGQHSEHHRQPRTRSCFQSQIFPCSSCPDFHKFDVLCPHRNLQHPLCVPLPFLLHHLDRHSILPYPRRSLRGPVVSHRNRQPLWHRCHFNGLFLTVIHSGQSAQYHVCNRLDDRDVLLHRRPRPILRPRLHGHYRHSPRTRERQHVPLYHSRPRQHFKCHFQPRAGRRRQLYHICGHLLPHLRELNALGSLRYHQNPFRPAFPLVVNHRRHHSVLPHVHRQLRPSVVRHHHSNPLWNRHDRCRLSISVILLRQSLQRNRCRCFQGRNSLEHILRCFPVRIPCLTCPHHYRPRPRERQYVPLHISRPRYHRILYRQPAPRGCRKRHLVCPHLPPHRRKLDFLPCPQHPQRPLHPSSVAYIRRLHHNRVFPRMHRRLFRPIVSHPHRDSFRLRRDRHHLCLPVVHLFQPLQHHRRRHRHGLDLLRHRRRSTPALISRLACFYRHRPRFRKSQHIPLQQPRPRNHRKDYLVSTRCRGHKANPIGHQLRFHRLEDNALLVLFARRACNAEPIVILATRRGIGRASPRRSGVLRCMRPTTSASYACLSRCRGSWSFWIYRAAICQRRPPPVQAPFRNVPMHIV